MVKLRVYWAIPEKDGMRGFTTIIDVPVVLHAGCHLTFGGKEVFKIRYIAYEVDSGEFVAHLVCMKYADDAIKCFMKHPRSSEFAVTEEWLAEHYEKFRFGREE